MVSLFLFCSFLCIASEKADIQVVVTAARDEKKITEVPADITVISSKQLENRTIVQALETFGGVTVTSFNGNSSQASVSMRGFGENSHGRVLVLVDGIRQNNPDMSGTDWLSLPASAVERIEIMRGGASVLYGNNAVAGVISIFTRRADRNKSVAADAEASVTSFGGHSERWYVSGGGEKLSLYLSGTGESSEGWRDRSGFSLRQLSTALSYSDEKCDAGMNLSFFTTDYEMPGALLKEKYDEDPKQAAYFFDEAEMTGFSAAAHITHETTDMLKLKLTGGFKHKENGTDMESWFSWTDTDTNSLYVSPSVILTFNQDSFTNILTLGGDFHSDRLRSRGFNDRARENETWDNDVTKLSGGIFALNELKLLDETLTLTFGIRGEREQIESDFGSASTAEDDEEIFTPVSMTAGINYLFPDCSNAYFRYDRVYRTPFTDEQVSYQGYGEGFNSSLEPEYGHSFELGFNFNGISWLSLGASGYVLAMKDEIAYNGITFRNENMNDTIHYGINAEASLTAGFFTLDAGYSRNVAEFTAGEHDGNRVPLVPEHRFSLVPEISLPYGFSVSSDIIYTGKYYIGQDYDNSMDENDSHIITGLTVKYSCEGKYKGTLFARVNNLFDVEYATAAYVGYDSMYNPTESFYSGPGREFVFGGSLSY